MPSDGAQLHLVSWLTILVRKCSVTYTVKTLVKYIILDDFMEIPVDTTCALGETFNVTCSPPKDAGTARWVFNGERLITTHPPDGVTPSSFNNLFHLQISCTLARHYITLQCIAVTVTDTVFLEEESSPVTIRVEG